jgi:hypothetical protein
MALAPRKGGKIGSGREWRETRLCSEVVPKPGWFWNNLGYSTGFAFKLKSGSQEEPSP